MLAVLLFRAVAALMWCSQCQLDVAEQASPALGGFACGKCGQTLASTSNTADADGAKLDHRAAQIRPNQALLMEDDWALEAELRGLEKLVGSLRTTGARGESPLAIHAGHAMPMWHAENRELAEAAEAKPASTLGGERPKSSFVAWTILSLGLATFACGAMLLIWSFVGQREDLWPLGVPLALLGQAGLVLGLILQLDGLSQTSRKTAQTLHELDGELARVRQTTSRLTTSHAAPGQSFYAHLAQGAAPQLLLADLKGQLDLLARQMTDRRS